MEIGELLTLYLVDLQAGFRKNILEGDLTLTQSLILLTIPDDGFDMTSLSQQIGVDNSTATRLVDNLIKKRWVLKEKNVADRRSSLVKLTGKGEAIRKKIEKRIDEYGEMVKSSLPPEDLEETKEILSTFYWSLVKARLK